MCYNSECRIKIKSIIDGFESTVMTMGKITRTSSETRFDYDLDGDSCTLSVKKGEVVQVRRGEQNIRMTFRKGEKTECSLGSGGFSGTFPVFTSDLRYKTCPNGRVELSIVYTLGEQTTELNFSAE